MRVWRDGMGLNGSDWSTALEGCGVTGVGHGEVQGTKGEALRMGIRANL
jgi:hypothetical protein